MTILKQLTASNIMLFMVDSADHRTGKTGLTLSFSISKGGGPFSSVSPVVVERGNGWYSVALTAIMTDVLGDLALHVTAVGADPLDVVYSVSKDGILQSNDVWAYNRRTLSPAPQEYVTSDGVISMVRGDTFTYEFTEVDLEGYNAAYFTVKSQYKDEDAQAVLQVNAANGLIILNGQKRSSGAGATMSLDSANSTVSLEIDANITKCIPYSDNDYLYDLEIIGSSNEVYTPQIGKFVLVRDVTRKIS